MLLTAEIFPTRIRGVANGVVWAIASFVGFVPWPFAAVALWLLAMALGVWLWVPEHAGKELNKISV